MLHIHHRLREPRLGTTFTQDELRAKDFIVVRSTHEGGRNDDAIERAVTSEGSGFAMVRFILEGPTLVRHVGSEATVHAGQCIASREMRASLATTLELSNDMIGFAWRPSSPLAYDGIVDLAPGARQSLLRLARAMRTPDSEEAIACLRDATSALRASGIPIDVPRVPVPHEAHVVARAIERVVFPMSSSPMAIDLASALGVGTRQALRRANAFFRDYYASGSTWRDYLHAMRIGLSTFFMSHPEARTDHVSRFMGFASPTSFCHALHLAGLPSPQAIQRALA